MKNTNIKINDTIDGIIQINGSGSGYLINENISKDVFIQASNTNIALDSDVVKIKITSTKNGKIEGVVIDIIKRSKEEYVGTINIVKDLYVFTSDSTKISTKFNITPLKTIGANDNEKVVVKIINWKEGSDRPVAEVIKILGKKGEHETEIHSIMETFGLPYEFPDSVIEEVNNISEEISQEEIDKRLDLRDILTVGIDPENSKDADDTIGLKWENGIANVYVNIADITHYVKPNSLVDNEAYSRANSVYLCDRCIPMIPERLSSNICSLKSGSDKLTFSAIFKIDNRGNVIEAKFYKSIINVDKDFTYEEAQKIIEGETIQDKKMNQMILDLDRVAKLLRKNRIKNGFLNIDSSEVSFILDVNNKPIDVMIKTSKDSNKLIEEFMLLTNKEVSKFIKSKGLSSINRVHESPDINKLNELKNFVKNFGYEFNIDEDIVSSINKLLHESKNSPEGDIINKLIIKTQQKAKYSSLNLHHFGLNFKDYSHFTSGIRRYSDIICHFFLAKALGNDGYPIK